MNSSDVTNRLSEKQKQRLVEAKNQEDLDQLFTPDDVSLSDDQLEDVSGGCFRPKAPTKTQGQGICSTCGSTGTAGELCCFCGAGYYIQGIEHPGNRPVKIL